MRIWVIYSHPSDYPQSNFVVREHEVNKGYSKPTRRIHAADSIGKVRRYVPHGKQRVERRDTDPLQIVEWWF